jgi:TATA-binding protein-associated factor Taf7
MSHSDFSVLSVLRTEPIVRDRKRPVSTFFEDLYLVADLSEVTLSRERDASPNRVSSLGVKRSRTSADLSSFFESNNKTMSDTDSEQSFSSKEEDSDSSTQEEEDEDEEDDQEKKEKDQTGRGNKRQCFRHTVIEEEDNCALFF